MRLMILLCEAAVGCIRSADETVGWGGRVLIQPPDEPRGSVCSPKLPPAMSPLLDSHRLPLITFLLCCCGSRVNLA